MTVPNANCRTSALGSDTAGQEIPFTFAVNDTDELGVYSRITASGVEVKLTEDTDYTVELASDSGGTVTMIAAWAGTYEIHVVRETDVTQDLDLEQGGAFSAENVEDALDKLTMQNAEQADLLARCIHAAVTDDTLAEDLDIPDVEERKGQFLYFKASDGSVTVGNLMTVGEAVISSFGADLIADANAAAAWTTLSFSSAVQSILDDTSISAIQTTLGISAFIKTLIDDTTATEAKATLELEEYEPDAVVCWRGETIVWNDNILTV